MALHLFAKNTTHRKVVIAAITAIAALQMAGCAPSTALGVRAMGESRQVTFTAHENYQPIYRRILDMERKCWQSGLITAQMVVSGDLFHDIKTGTITTALHGGLGVDTYRVIDIVALDEISTKVTGYFAVGSVAQYGQILKEWALNKSEECGLNK